MCPIYICNGPTTPYPTHTPRRAPTATPPTPTEHNALHTSWEQPLDESHSSCNHQAPSSVHLAGNSSHQGPIICQPPAPVQDHSKALPHLMLDHPAHTQHMTLEPLPRKPGVSGLRCHTVCSPPGLALCQCRRSRSAALQTFNSGTFRRTDLLPGLSASQTHAAAHSTIYLASGLRRTWR